MVTPGCPLRPLVDPADGDGDSDDNAAELSINDSILASGDVNKIKEQLPIEHPVRGLLTTADEIRSKLSPAQLADLLVMIGDNNFIK